MLSEALAGASVRQMTRKECPLCGELMDRRDTTTTTQIPGNPKPTVHAVHEWVCPDCDYFEEAGGDDED
jgi:YgiT-type zinc finger domain-containing protein